MKIRVNAVDGPHFTIPVPLFLAGSPMILNMVTKYGGSDVAKFAPYAGELVGELREYIRRNGQFTLLHVEDSEGDLVEITV